MSTPQDKSWLRSRGAAGLAVGRVLKSPRFATWSNVQGHTLVITKIVEKSNVQVPGDTLFNADYH